MFGIGVSLDSSGLQKRDGDNGMEGLYRLLPVPVQNLACTLYGFRERRVRLSRFFWDRYEWLLQTEGASTDEIRAYQDEQVALLIEHAYNSVPYYRRVMDERGLKPKDIVSVQDLRKLPVLLKEDVVGKRADFLSSATNQRQLVPSKTSGTTGTALVFFKSKEAVAFQWAVWWRHRSRFGFRPLTWHLNFTGRPVVPASQSSPPYWRWNLPMRQALISMQQLRPDRVVELAKFVDSHRFPYFTGYPSFIHMFAYLLEDRGIELQSHPKYVFLGAENTYDFQREAIERVLKTRVTDQYGFSEGAGNASKCEYGVYHEDWEFGVLECGDPTLMADGAVRGKIVATGFSNYAFPFIRYEVGDTAVWAPPGYQCPCGRQSRVILRIEGRTEDYVITPEGMRVMRFDYLFKDTESIREAQVVQREEGSIVIRVVKRPTYSRTVEDHIREKVRNWISPSLKVYFEYVDEIPRSRSGKFRAVVSELSGREAFSSD